MKARQKIHGATPSGSGCQPSASAANASSQSGIPSAPRRASELNGKPKPSTAKELAELSTWYFGVPLSLEKLWVGNGIAQYRVHELYNDYHGRGFLFGENCIRGYDYSRDFWRHVIGELYCGGIADHSYGQTRHNPSEQGRLEALAISVLETAKSAGGAS